jgi:ankyrin repeat protein
LNVVILVFFCSGNTPLHQSSEKGHMDECQFLVASHADVTSMNMYCRLSSAALSCSTTYPLLCSWGRSPLQLAIQNNKSDVAAFLRRDRCLRLFSAALLCSATHPLRCSCGSTPLQLANLRSQRNVAAFLKTAAATSALQTAGAASDQARIASCAVFALLCRSA